MNRLDQRRRRGRRDLGRLDYRGAARCQGRAQLTHRKVDRVVPGNDKRGDASWLGQNHVPEFGQRRARHLSLKETGSPRVVAQLVDGAFDFPRQVDADRLAHLAGDQLADRP